MGSCPRSTPAATASTVGSITKTGPRELRSLLVQAAWVYWRTVKTGPLREWVDRVAARRGNKVAVVALARRLSRILFAIWRDGTVYQATRPRK